MTGPVLPRERIIAALETVIVSGDRIVLEGDNQKQADSSLVHLSRPIRRSCTIYI